MQQLGKSASEEDLPSEEEITQNKYCIRSWLHYIEFKLGTFKPRQNQLYERALNVLPGSYKLWSCYLKEQRTQVKHCCVTDPTYEDVNNCHERAYVFMHKMPRLWLYYCQLLMDQGCITHPPHLRPRPAGPAHHSTLPHLDPVPAFPGLTPSAGDSHSSLLVLPQGESREH